MTSKNPPPRPVAATITTQGNDVPATAPDLRFFAAGVPDADAQGGAR